eukprot:TRINITY_DN88320_c0_g1_i1.p1 TRINITY_DN88320_c0_g1~~TRINITY_DN88320_c0_g1_i1.p1  ORF type:complete len:161 (+),score=10.23 TRINITY_DN88320_c0_g1_i1:68-484(+)
MHAKKAVALHGASLLAMSRSIAEFTIAQKKLYDDIYEHIAESATIRQSAFSEEEQIQLVEPATDGQLPGRLQWLAEYTLQQQGMPATLSSVVQSNINLLPAAAVAFQYQLSFLCPVEHVGQQFAVALRIRRSATASQH